MVIQGDNAWYNSFLFWMVFDDDRVVDFGDEVLNWRSLLFLLWQWPWTHISHWWCQQRSDADFELCYPWWRGWGNIYFFFRWLKFLGIVCLCFVIFFFIFGYFKVHVPIAISRHVLSLTVVYLPGLGSSSTVPTLLSYNISIWRFSGSILLRRDGKLGSWYSRPSPVSCTGSF